MKKKYGARLNKEAREEENRDLYTQHQADDTGPQAKLLMNKLFYSIFLCLFIQGHSSYSQDCFECESGDYSIDTSKVIAGIKNRYAYLTSLNNSDFDYVFSQRTETGCYEPDELHSTTYYLNDQLGIVSLVKKGSGEGGYYSNSYSYEYYHDNLLIFQYLIYEGLSMNKAGDSYREEYRIYYDQCGRIIRKLHKKVTGDMLTGNQTLDETLQRMPNTDLTPKGKN